MSQAIIYIIILFSILGAIDTLLGNKFGIGKKFQEGIEAMGGLALTMLGIYCLSPVIAEGLIPILLPISKVTGADPSIFITSILAPDIGGFTSAMKVASTESIGYFSGLILSSSMGATISFTTPIAINLLKEDFPHYAKGIMAGFITIPIGAFIGGILIGIPLKELLINLIPVLIMSLILMVCLIKIQEKIVKLFIWIGKTLVLISTIGLIVGILDFVLDIKLLPNMIPLEEGLIIVGQIAIILSGAYPLFHILSKVSNKYLSKIGDKLDINQVSVLGLLISLVNSIPMLTMYKDMDERGKNLNAAFVVSGAYTFGGQLGFVSSISQEMVSPFIVSKLIAGITAVLLACFFTRNHIKTELG